DGWRERWAAAGVICDELSAPVLTLNLGSGGDGLSDRVLAMHAERGEACSLSLRQLLRHRPSFGHLDGRSVFVVENPTVVAVAVERLGVHCAPLVCTSGHPRGATRLLLRELARAGARLQVQADFDIDGLHIAAQTLAIPGSRPWRMRASDYRAALGGPPLRRASVPVAEWDAELAPAMSERGVGVHEESMLDVLLAELDRRGS
ncbi:MAG: TIGR02679 family protein, partial [Myxococcales bacterium]|nr:TIGR02679 family protein [Myxococcales bacterium]